MSFEKNCITQRLLYGIRFDRSKNEMLGVVGESGSGKSMTALSIMRLLKTPLINGEIIYNDIDINKTPSRQMESIRGHKISMIFQEPMSALNPSMRCGTQVKEILLQHHIVSPTTAKLEVIKLFESVNIPSPEQAYTKYPHELSGGQPPRVMHAMSIACTPAG